MAARLMSVGNNIPVWVAFLATHVVVFATWNPTGWDLFHFVTFSNYAWSVRAFVGCLCLAILSLYLFEVFNSFNKWGAVVFVMLVGTTIYLAVDFGVMDYRNTALWRWLVPIIIAEFFTLALLSPRVLRYISGRVPVQSTGSEDHTVNVNDQPHH